MTVSLCCCKGEKKGWYIKLCRSWGYHFCLCVPSYNLQNFPKTRRRHHLHLWSAQDELYVCVTLYLSKNEHSLQREKSNWAYILVAWGVQNGNGGAEPREGFWSNGFDLVTSRDTTPEMSWPAPCHTMPTWLLPASSLANFLESISALK